MDPQLPVADVVTEGERDEEIDWPPVGPQLLENRQAGVDLPNSAFAHLSVE
jgi:hypothetical protein